MGRMIYAMLQSVDGYIAGPPGGPDMPMFGEELHRYFNRQMEQTSLSVYGRTMYEIMRAWETWEEDFPNSAPYEDEFARAWRETPKVVVSTTLATVGPNARLVSTDVDGELRRIKAGTDGVIEIAGSVLAATAGRLGLIDEYVMYVRPAVLGGGKPFFRPDLPLNLEPAGSETLPEGTLLVRYRPAGQS